jgi:hypothetical protein
MEFALALLKLWKLRIWVGFGLVLAAVAAFGSLNLGHSAVYAAAQTEMIVDSPQSALGNSQSDLTPYLTRAEVFARMMTSNEALNYIGQAAHVPGQLIAATGPEEIGAPVATHAATATKNGTLVAPSAAYSLRFDQNPLLPTIDIYATAPTDKQALALANGAVTGFTAYLSQLQARGNVPVDHRVQIHQLGAATGGLVDPGASKSIAGIAFVAVFIMWCCAVLVASKFRETLRAAKARKEAGALEAAAGGLVPDGSHLSAVGSHVASDLHRGDSSHLSGVPSHGGSDALRRLLRQPSPNENGSSRSSAEAAPPSEFARRS